MNRLTDQQLLRDYTGRRSEAAFAELVRRHVDFVYSAALRMVRDSHLAEDVTQGVFVAFAQNARQLTDRPVLSGWLHRTAQNLAANTVRSDVRRRAREQEVVAMNELLATEPDAVWEHIAPHLDAALGELSEPDRDALLLRYFERKSAREMAQTLGVSDEAAQKRVSRAVERLRELFAKRGVTAGASGLVIAISVNAVQATPVGLAVTISTTAALTGAAVSASTVIAATKTIAMTTLQKTLVTATVAVLAGAGIYEAHQAARLREQSQTLQQQQAPLDDQLRSLQNRYSEASNQLAELAAENSALKSGRDSIELLKLRGDASRLTALTRENEELKMKLSEVYGRWHNVTNSPPLTMPYLPRGRWHLYPDDTPSAIFLAAAKAATEEDSAKIAEVLSDAGNASLFSKKRWENVKGIQIVNEAYITNNGKETARLDTILLLEIDGPSDPAQPPALDELVHTHPEMRRWYFAKTENGWKISGSD